MGPNLSGVDQAHQGLRNPELLGDFALRHRADRCKPAYFKNRPIRQLSRGAALTPAVRWPARVPPFLNAVALIVEISPKEKMRWAHAIADIAMMQHIEAVRYFTTKCAPRNAMSKNGAPTNLHVHIAIRPHPERRTPAARFRLNYYRRDDSFGKRQSSLHGAI